MEGHIPKSIAVQIELYDLIKKKKKQDENLRKGISSWGFLGILTEDSP